MAKALIGVRDDHGIYGRPFTIVGTHKDPNFRGPGFRATWIVRFDNGDLRRIDVLHGGAVDTAAGTHGICPDPLPPFASRADEPITSPSPPLVAS